MKNAAFIKQMVADPEIFANADLGLDEEDEDYGENAGEEGDGGGSSGGCCCPVAKVSFER